MEAIVTSEAGQSSESAVSLKDFAGLFFALVAVAAATLILFNASYNQENADLRIDHTREVYRDSEQLLVNSAQANTNVRNYIMTKDQKYLSLYEQSKTLLKEEASALARSTRTTAVKHQIERRLLPDLNAFLATSDKLVSLYIAGYLDCTHSQGQVALQEQENAGTSFHHSLVAVQGMQLSILQQRKDLVLQISNQIAAIRIGLLTAALLAIGLSIWTLQTVMKKDRQKIASLQAAVERIKRAEQSALESLSEAQKSNQLKVQFMANISHEIRTPMTGVLGLADLLSVHHLDPEAHKYAQTLMESTKQLLSVLNDLLNFSQLEKNELTINNKKFDIRQTINEVTSLAQIQAEEKHLNLTVTVDQNIAPMIMADEEKVRQVVSTLTANSLKFASDGSVQISAESLDQNMIRIAVSDTGIGIENKDLEKLFQPFVQVDGGIRRTHGGAGLSLSIAKHLVQLMDGQIGVLSEPGAGSIFWFTFKGAKANE